jgi:hypothetical protein
LFNSSIDLGKRLKRTGIALYGVNAWKNVTVQLTTWDRPDYCNKIYIISAFLHHHGKLTVGKGTDNVPLFGGFISGAVTLPGKLVVSPEFSSANFLGFQRKMN